MEHAGAEDEERDDGELQREPGFEEGVAGGGEGGGEGCVGQVLDADGVEDLD